MSFSADWLALREPIDHRSVSARLRERVAQHFAGRDGLRVVDLGCGSGSTLRGLAPFLGAHQHWTLVDWDEALLVHARAALTRWADEAAPQGETLSLVKHGKRIDVAFRQADLARNLASVLDPAPDLVTAAAFFDLVSREWIATFCSALAVRRLPLYTVLTYDGRETWSPPHACDAQMLEAFHAHQQSDKGFGRAAGPHAVAALAQALATNGYEVAREASPWILDGADASLITELAKGAAGAVAETGRVAAPAIADWLAARTPAAECSIGHEDVFACLR